MGGELPPHWLTYFMHDDVDAGLAKARELGGEQIGEPVDSPYGRYGRLRDPQGGGLRADPEPGLRRRGPRRSGALNTTWLRAPPAVPGRRAP